MKQEIAVFDYAKEILSAVSKGVLLTAKHGETVNVMTIGWGMLGIEWGLPVFTAFVREGRFTRELLDASGEFTVNIPVGSCDPEIIAYCGSKSGSDTDKAARLSLSAVESDMVQAPGWKELPLTLECKILYRQLQDKNAIPEEIRRSLYPENVDSSNPMANRDYHISYYGQVVRAYIIR